MPYATRLHALIGNYQKKYYYCDQAVEIKEYYILFDNSYNYRALD